MRKWLKELREDNKMSQTKAASALGVSQGFWSLIENGERQKKMSLELAQKISDVFDVSIDEILKNESEE